MFFGLRKSSKPVDRSSVSVNVYEPSIERSWVIFALVVASMPWAFACAIFSETKVSGLNDIRLSNELWKYVTVKLILSCNNAWLAPTSHPVLSSAFRFSFP